MRCGSAGAGKRQGGDRGGSAQACAWRKQGCRSVRRLTQRAFCKRRKTMTTTTTTSNGRAARKSLAEQIDRLDNLLEGLSENLTEAVADAVRAAVVTAGHTPPPPRLPNPQLLAPPPRPLPPSPPP